MRATSEPERLQPTFKGKSYTFADDKAEQLECYHNLIAQVHPKSSRRL